MLKLMHQARHFSPYKAHQADCIRCRIELTSGRRHEREAECHFEVSTKGGRKPRAW